MGRGSWVRELIARAPMSAEYGTPEFDALPAGPEKIASLARAAELWRLDGEEYPERLRAEMDALQAAYLAGFLDGENDAYRSRRDAHQASWNPKTGTFRPDKNLAARLEAEYVAWVRGEAS